MFNIAAKKKQPEKAKYKGLLTFPLAGLYDKYYHHKKRLGLTNDEFAYKMIEHCLDDLDKQEILENQG